MIGTYLLIATNAQAIARIPHHCTDAFAPRLCAIHHHRAATNRLRAQVGLGPLGYHYHAEHDPSVRDRVLDAWISHHRRAKQRAALDPAVVRTLLCIHPFEEPSWSTVAGGLGFVSPPLSYPQTSADRRLTGRLARMYGTSWVNWPRDAQLRVAAFLVRYYGFKPWSTAYHCV